MNNQQLDLNTLMNYMILMVVIVMMMRMVTRALEPAKPREVEKLYPGEVPPGYKPLHLRSSNPAYGVEGEHHTTYGYGEPKTEAERRETHLKRYGTEEIPEKGSGYGPAYGIEEKREIRDLLEGHTTVESWGVSCITDLARLMGEPVPTTREGKAQLIGRAEEYVEHHSIHGPERQKLVDQYGSWSVGRAEAVCPEGDIECVRMEAARLLGAYRRGYV